MSGTADRPRVSIIVPCYDKAAYVAAAIDSALAQTHPCEVVVIDDGSTDGSLDVLRRYNGRIVLETGPNRGACAARNRGLELATGDWIQFLDADDILPPDKIARQIARLRQAPADAVAACRWIRLYDDGRTDPPDPRPYWHDHVRGIDLLLQMWHRGGYLPTLAWLVPRALALATAPWDTALAADQDGDYFGRLLAGAGPVLFCDDTHVLYRAPMPGAVSSIRSRRTAGSRMRAFETVAERVLARRPDRAARRACLSRVRKLAYAAAEHDDLVDRACGWEHRLAVFDLSPALPPVTRVAVGLFGLRAGLGLIRGMRMGAAAGGVSGRN